MATGHDIEKKYGAELTPKYVTFKILKLQNSETLK